jgi:hypothetical protein
MGKNFIRNKKNKLRRARKLLEQHVIESTTGWPRPSTLEAVIRQMQTAMMQVEVMRIAAEIDYYKDEDANDPHRYVRNFDRNSRW